MKNEIINEKMDGQQQTPENLLDSSAIQPLFSEFRDDTFPVEKEENSTVIIRQTPTAKPKRKRERVDSESEAESDDNSDHRLSEIDNEKLDKDPQEGEDPEQLPAWMRYLPPRRFIKSPNSAFTEQQRSASSSTTMDISEHHNQSSFSTNPSSQQLLPHQQQPGKRKRIKYLSHSSDEAAALLSFFNFKQE